MQDESSPLMLPLTVAQVQLIANKARARPHRLHLLLAAASSDELKQLASAEQPRGCTTGSAPTG